MLKVYVSVEGLERLATNQPLYSWHHRMTREDEDCLKGDVLIGSFEPSYPSKEACIPPVLEKLKQREAEIQAEAYSEVQEIQERRNNLLALTYEEPAALDLQDPFL